MGLYVNDSDVPLGEFDTPRGMTLAQAIKQGEEEIDAVVGQIYSLPLTLNEQNPEQRGDALLLRKINRYLAVGKMATYGTAYDEESELHAFGAWHLRQAEAALQQIASGKVVLNSQPRLDADNEAPIGGPVGSKRDDVSMVDDFYTTTTGPQRYGDRMSIPPDRGRFPFMNLGRG